MPKFSIYRNGEKLSELTLEGERIELGSAHTCPLVIDDLRISLKQAAFVRQPDGSSYHVEPLSRVPAFNLDGEVVHGSMAVVEGSVITIEGYEIRLTYPEAKKRSAASAAAGAGESQQVVNQGNMDEPAVPSPLEPDLPPPLDLDSPVKPPPTPAPRSARPPAPDPGSDMDRTVYVRTVGKLVAISGPYVGKEWDLKVGETAIGRDATQNQIVIRLDSQGQVDTSVSRRHATVHVIGEQVFIEDKDSAAGTYVNGRKVPAGQRVEIHNQGQVEVRSARESTILQLQLVGVAPPRPAEPQVFEPLVPPTPSPAPSPPPPLTPRPSENVPEFDPILSLSSEDVPSRGVREAQPQSDPARSAAPSVFDDNPFLPLEDESSRRSWPRWTWAVVAVAVVVLAGVIFIWLT